MKKLCCLLLSVLLTFSSICMVSFAEPNMEGILFWGYWDGSNFEARSPFCDKDFNLKPAGKAFRDLVYNKFVK